MVLKIVIVYNINEDQMYSWSINITFKMNGNKKRSIQHYDCFISLSKIIYNPVLNKIIKNSKAKLLYNHYTTLKEKLNFSTL